MKVTRPERSSRSINLEFIFVAKAVLIFNNATVEIFEYLPVLL